jgi:hypothetical protein
MMNYMKIGTLVGILVIALFFVVQVNEAAVTKCPAATENASASNSQVVDVDDRPAKVSFTSEDRSASIAHLGCEAESELVSWAVGLVSDFTRRNDNASEFVFAVGEQWTQGGLPLHLLSKETAFNNRGRGISDVDEPEPNFLAVKIYLSHDDPWSMRREKFGSGEINALTEQASLDVSHPRQYDREDRHYKRGDSSEVIGVAYPIPKRTEPDQFTHSLSWFPWALFSSPFVGFLIGSMIIWRSHLWV